MSEFYREIMNEEENFIMTADQDQAETMNPDLLLVAKSEVQAVSEEQGTVTSAGTLKELAPAMVWEGSISPQARIDEGRITAEEVAEVRQSIGKQYVPVVDGAPIRCGDGRILAEYNPDDSELYGRVLGPQLFGGSYGLALAHRIAVGGVSEFPETGITVKDDIKTVDQASLKAGFSAGGHTDIRNCNGGSKCGCGAVDTTTQQFDRLGDENQIMGASQLTQARLGDRFNAEHFNIAIASAIELRDALNQYSVPAQEVLNTIKEDNPGSVEVLSQPHNESDLVINLVEGTTLHRDELATETDGEVEAFGSDDWALWDIAAELYPKDKQAQSIFVHSFMLKDALTLPGLIAEDGSVNVSVRQAAIVEN